MSAEISNKKKMECSVRTIDKRKKGDAVKSDIGEYLGLSGCLIFNCRELVGLFRKFISG